MHSATFIFTFLQGPIGPIGAPGSPGAAGVMGMKGDRGKDGKHGKDGPPGPPVSITAVSQSVLCSVLTKSIVLSKFFGVAFQSSTCTWRGFSVSLEQNIGNNEIEEPPIKYRWFKLSTLMHHPFSFRVISNQFSSDFKCINQTSSTMPLN